MTTRRYRRGSRSPFRRYLQDGSATISANTTNNVVLLGPGANDQQRVKRARIILQVNHDGTNRHRGWFGLSRLADNAVAFSPDFHGPRLLRPQLWQQSGTNDMFFQSFLPAITLDAEDDLYLHIRNEGSTPVSVEYQFLCYIDYQGS